MKIRLDIEDLDAINAVAAAQRRLTTRLYISSTQETPWGRDKGTPSRYVRRVFDERDVEESDDWEWEAVVIGETPAGRKQFQLHIAREDGAVREILIQKISENNAADKLETVLKLDRDQSARLLDTLRVVESLPVENGQNEKIDDHDLRAFLADPSAAAAIYSRDPDTVRQLIQSDSAAEDVVALQRRREVVSKMQLWLNDGDEFENAKAEAGGPEKAWQRLLEANPWILGIGLGAQLFTSWDDKRLEQTILGHSIGTVGKRPDAVLRTSGVIQTMAFAEIKHHETSLLAKKPYRPGCLAPSTELSGAVAQAQQTADLAVRTLESYLPDKSADGETLASGTYIARPRSFVVIGHLGQLQGPAGGDMPDKIRSFELFRRSLHEPEIITFDELLARAQWSVQMATEAADSQLENESSSNDPGVDRVDDDPWGDVLNPWA